MHVTIVFGVTLTAPLLLDGATCVSDCGPKSFPVDGTCVPCDGECPRGTFVTIGCNLVSSVRISLTRLYYCIHKDVKTSVVSLELGPDRV